MSNVAKLALPKVNPRKIYLTKINLFNPIPGKGQVKLLTSDDLNV